MAKILDSTPAELGYLMPPEWHVHEATWFSWPRPEGASFPGRYQSIPENMAHIIRPIAERERVRILVPNSNYQQIVEHELRAHRCHMRSIEFFHIPTDEAWYRDSGPMFLQRRRRDGSLQTAIVAWDFNGWGRKIERYRDDDEAPVRVAEALKLPLFLPRVTLEGGSVDFSGEGTVLTTESCLLNPNRNPSLSRLQIERRVKAFFGQRQVIWLFGGLAGDDTDGHVDTVARFITPSKIAIAVDDDPQSVNYAATQENLRRLQQARDTSGRPFEIIRLPMPRAITREGMRLPATYANFYFVNGALLVPTYRDRRHDSMAMGILREHLPDRDVIGVDCCELIWGLGAIHCLTQQQPKT
jgi:agmatine deiminase